MEDGVVLSSVEYGYIMADPYFTVHPFVRRGLVDPNTCRRLYYLLADGPKPMSAFQNEWSGELSQKQIRTKIEGLVGKVLSKSGKNRGTVYQFVKIG